MNTRCWQIGANGWLGKWDGEIGEGITVEQCSIQLLHVPLPAVLPARIIPAEHVATDAICLHELHLLGMVEVCRMGCLDAGEAGPLQPHNPCDPAAFPGAFCIPSPSWQPHSSRLIAPSCSLFGAGVGGVR